MFPGEIVRYAWTEDRILADRANAAAGIRRSCYFRAEWNDIRLGNRVRYEHQRIFFLGQNCAEIQPRAARHARTSAATLRGDGTSLRQRQSSDAEALCDSGRSAECVRHGPQSKACFRRSHGRTAEAHE